MEITTWSDSESAAMTDVSECHLKTFIRPEIPMSSPMSTPMPIPSQPPSSTDPDPDIEELEDLILNFGPAWVFLLGQVKEKQSKRMCAGDCYRECLKAAPFMIEAVQRLAALGKEDFWKGEKVEGRWLVGKAPKAKKQKNRRQKTVVKNGVIVKKDENDKENQGENDKENQDMEALYFL